MRAPTRAIHALGVVAAIVLASGCKLTLSTQSAAPPGRTARLDVHNGFWGVHHYSMELSQGVALAMTCHEGGGPCKGMSVVSANPAIAEIHRASLSALEPSGYGVYSNPSNAAAVVVVGKAPGKTKIKVTSGESSRELEVTVVPPPGPIVTQATSAR